MSTPARREWWASGPVGRPSTQPALRIGDADRAGAVEALGEHFATGRLTHEEYDERATRALQARTAADVAPLFTDLPAPYPPVLTGRPATPTPARPPRGRVASAVAGAAPRPPRRLPVLPMFLVLVGLALLLEEGAVLLFGLAALWWFGALRWRRTREQWATRWHGAPGPHGWAGPGHHRNRC